MHGDLETLRARKRQPSPHRSILDEISPYKAFASAALNTSHAKTHGYTQTDQRSRKQSAMSFYGADAVLVRRTLHAIHNIASNKTPLDEGQMDFIESMEPKLDNMWLWVRSLFIGTAPGFNVQLLLLPPSLQWIAHFWFNHFLRSFGNMYWCLKLRP